MIRRYADLSHKGYEKIAGKGSIIYAIQLAIKNELDHGYVDVLDRLSQKKGQTAIQPDVKFFRSLIEKDKVGCEEAINELLTPKRHKQRNKYMELVSEFISHPAIGYAKLAWLKGVNVEIDNSLVPKSVLPVDPNECYYDEYDFLKGSRELKWHEKIFTGAISAAIGIVFLFNVFSYLTSLFISEAGVEGGPTKQKALVAFFSMLEDGWWKYPIFFVFLLIGFLEIRSGVRKYSSGK